MFEKGNLVEVVTYERYWASHEGYVPEDHRNWLEQDGSSWSPWTCREYAIVNQRKYLYHAERGNPYIIEDTLTLDDIDCYRLENNYIRKDVFFPYWMLRTPDPKVVWKYIKFKVGDEVIYSPKGNLLLWQERLVGKRATVTRTDNLHWWGGGHSRWPLSQRVAEITFRNGDRHAFQIKDFILDSILWEV